MNLIAHFTPHELPLGLAALIAGIALGTFLAFAVLRSISRRD